MSASERHPPREAWCYAILTPLFATPPSIAAANEPLAPPEDTGRDLRSPARSHLARSHLEGIHDSEPFDLLTVLQVLGEEGGRTARERLRHDE